MEEKGRDCARDFVYISICTNLSNLSNLSVSVSVAEWFWSPPLDQQVDLEGLGSNPGAGKLDSGFQLPV